MKTTVYHGSHRYFEFPNLLKSKKFRDFGTGFYVTEHFVDAINILGQNPGYVYEYELDTTELKNLKFCKIEETAEFIIDNRSKELNSEFDLITGETLSDCSKLFRDVRNKGKQVSLANIVNLLAKSPYSEQICIKSDKALNSLKLKSIHEYSKEDFY